MHHFDQPPVKQAADEIDDDILGGGDSARKPKPPAPTAGTVFGKPAVTPAAPPLAAVQTAPVATSAAPVALTAPRAPAAATSDDGEFPVHSTTGTKYVA